MNVSSEPAGSGARPYGSRNIVAGYLTVSIGNLLVGRVMREGARRREAARVLEGAAGVQALLVFAIAGVGLIFTRPGLLPAGLAIALWQVFGFILGLATPIRMVYINEHIPSAERATVLLLDSFFGDAGGVVGQPALGWVSGRVSIPVGWLIGGVFMAVAPLLYGRSATAARAERDSRAPCARSPARSREARRAR